MRADWLAGFLCEQDVTRSFTVIYTPLGRRLARRQALAVATRVGASIDERELKGRRVGAEERRAQLAAEALDEELESGAEMELVVGLVDVTAERPDELARAVRAHLPVGGERRAWSSARSTSATPRRSSPRSPSAVSSRDGHDELRRTGRAPRRWSSRDKAPCSPSRFRRKENRASCASAGSR